jgi:HAD superfamily hydrolase (TIGR01484 family)
MIKLVAIDLDGTLLNEEKRISDRNKEALRKAKEQGVKIVLCTGRPLAAMAHYLEELTLSRRRRFQYHLQRRIGSKK